MTTVRPRRKIMGCRPGPFGPGSEAGLKRPALLMIACPKRPALLMIAVFTLAPEGLLTAQATPAIQNATTAQVVPTKNPVEGNPDAIRAGMGLFRSRCADCHGVDARGV